MDIPFEEFMDLGCPVCGADPGLDCFADCEGMDVPPTMYKLVEEQMNYISHKVSKRVMKRFKAQLLTEKAQEVIKDWTDFTGLAETLSNADVLKTNKDVVRFFQKPDDFSLEYAIWNELGKPRDEKSETWTMFMEAIRDRTSGKQT